MVGDRILSYRKKMGIFIDRIIFKKYSEAVDRRFLHGFWIQKWLSIKLLTIKGSKHQLTNL